MIEYIYIYIYIYFFFFLFVCDRAERTATHKQSGNWLSNGIVFFFLDSDDKDVWFFALNNSIILSKKLREEGTETR